jgi:methanogenic corrinoid protein MtbC1
MSRDAGDGDVSHSSRQARIEQFGDAYLGALLACDVRAAEIAVREAIDAKLSVAEVDDQIIAPGLRLVGDLWQQGEISLADEYIATEISMRVLALEREARRVAHARVMHRVMLATPAGDQHVVALRIVSDLLRDAGYEILMLGADVPPDALAQSARHYRPQVICVSATIPGRSDCVLDSIDAVRLRCPSVGFVLGGAGLTGDLRFRPNVRICRRISEIVEAVDAVVKRAALN